MFFGIYFATRNQYVIIMFNKIPTDKLLHLLVCFVLALVAWLFSGPVIPDWPVVFVILIRLIISFVVAALFSIGKEIYDSKQPGNHFCKRDLLWDFIGAVLGCVIGVIHFLIS